MDYRKCNLRIGVTGSASKDSASRLATDAKKCEANGDYLHVYFAEKSNGTKYYRAMVASNNITVGKFCVVKCLYQLDDGLYKVFNFADNDYGFLPDPIDFIDMNLFGKRLAEVFDNEGDRYLRAWDYVIESPYGFR